MLRARNYAGVCWWCGAKADSREHKYKKSDLVREFGAGPYVADGAVVRGIEETLRAVKGPGSRDVKFEESLCQRCNTARSSDMDRAYESFTAEIRTSEDDILKTNVCRWKGIFGDEWVTGRDDVKRYLAKHAASRLASAEIEVGRGIIDFLNRQTDRPSGLDIRFEIRMDIVAMLRQLKDGNLDTGSLWLGDLGCIRNTRTGTMRNAYSFYGYRWLRMNWEYDGHLCRRMQFRRRDGRTPDQAQHSAGKRSIIRT